MFGRRSKKKSSRKGCTRKLVTITKKRGGRVYTTAEFYARKGPGCGPRKKPSTAKLAPYKKAMARASRACKGKKLKAFRACVRQNYHHEVSRAW